jgi:hypothetical protein
MDKFYQVFKDLRDRQHCIHEDCSKIRLLKKLISVHRNYSEMKKYAQHNYFAASKKGKERDENDELRHGSFFISRLNPFKHSRTFSFSFKKKLCKTYADNDNELKMIKFAFEKAVGVYSENDQNERKKALLLPDFIQFLLNCYIITQHFLSLFLLPVGKEIWINEDKFVLSLESIQQMPFERASFFYHENDTQFKKNAVIQKMLCN